MLKKCKAAILKFNAPVVITLHKAITARSDAILNL